MAAVVAAAVALVLVFNANDTIIGIRHCFVITDNVTFTGKFVTVFLLIIVLLRSLRLQPLLSFCC